MDLITLIIVLAIIGFLMWLVNVYIPMDSRWKALINIIAMIFMVIWLLQTLGMLGSVRPVIR